MPTFKQLDAFVALADSGSISAAARRLGIAQSAASKHVSEFEALFPRPLLDRTGRNAALTVDGGEVLVRSRKVLARRDSVLASLSSNELPLRRIRIGVTEVVALTWLNVLMRELRTRYPNVEIQLKVEVSVLLREQLRSGQLDAVVVPDATSTPNLFKARLGAVVNNWYCSPSLHSGRASLTRAGLSRFDLLSQGPLARPGMPLDEWLQNEGITPKSVISSSSLLAVLDLMVAGMGIAHLPEPLVRDLVRSRKVVQLKVIPKTSAVDYVLLMREEESAQLHARLLEITRSSCDFSISSKESPTSIPLRKPNAEDRA